MTIHDVLDAEIEKRREELVLVFEQTQARIDEANTALRLRRNALGLYLSAQGARKVLDGEVDLGTAQINVYTKSEDLARVLNEDA